MDQCAYAQPQQTRQRAAPRQAQQAKGVDDPRWRDLMDQAEAQIAKGEWVKGYNERIKVFEIPGLDPVHEKTR